MISIIEKVSDELKTLKPYVKKFLGFGTAVYFSILSLIKKSNRKAKMHIRFLKIKEVLEIISSITLIIAAIIALFCAIGEYIKKSDN